MSEGTLPAAYEGRWVRLRPVARSDHPQLFAQRISLSETRLQILGGAIPTFERWEANELAEMLQSGPALIAEDFQGSYCGLARLYRLELRDQRSYVEFRLVPGVEEGPALETGLAFLDYAFAYMNLRKVYAEVLSCEEDAEELFARLGFVEEVRLPEYAKHDGRYLDLVYHCLTRAEWERAREHIETSLDLSRMAEAVVG